MKAITIPKEDKVLLIYNEENNEVYKVYKDYRDNHLILTEVKESDLVSEPVSIMNDN